MKKNEKNENKLLLFKCKNVIFHFFHYFNFIKNHLFIKLK